MSILGFFKRMASAGLLRQLEAPDPNVRSAAAVKVARTRDKAKAADVLVRYYQDILGIGRYVTPRQWEEFLKKSQQNRKLLHVVDFIKLDLVASYHQDRRPPRLAVLSSIIGPLEPIAKSLR